MTRLWLGFVVLAAAAPIWPQERFNPRPSTRPEIFDTRPVALDPAHFHMIFENDRVQVMRVRLGPHEKSMLMEIPAHVMTCVTDQHLRVIRPRGKAAERTEKAGYSGWVESDEYALENLEDKPAEWILVAPNGREKGE